MRRDARCYLWDALKAAEAVQSFLRGRTYCSVSRKDLQDELDLLCCVACGQAAQHWR